MADAAIVTFFVDFLSEAPDGYFAVFNPARKDPTLFVSVLSLKSVGKVLKGLTPSRRFCCAGVASSGLAEMPKP